MTTPAPPIPTAPTVDYLRPGGLPDVLAVQCFGEVEGCRPHLRVGTTPMGYEQRTIVRDPGEADTHLWARVQAVVSHFKNLYGWQQRVNILCLYELTVEQGYASADADQRVNLNAALRYTISHTKSERVRALCFQTLRGLYDS